LHHVLDRETGESAGAGGIQVVGLETTSKRSHRFGGSSVHFHSIDELKQAIVKGSPAVRGVTED
jgi:hypothetical protein